MIPDFLLDSDDEQGYDHHQIYERKLSKIDQLMISLSPDGKNLVIFDPRLMKIMASPSDQFINLNVDDLVTKNLDKESIDKGHVEFDVISNETSETSNDVKISVVEISESRDNERSAGKVEINFQQSFYNSRDYMNDDVDIQKKIEIVSFLKGWSVTISDRYYCAKLGRYDNLIALSRIEKSDVENVIEDVKGYVVVFSVAALNGLFDPKGGSSIMINFGGVVDFFNMGNEQILCVKNRHGIYRYLITDKGKILMRELEKFDYPERIKNFDNENSFLDYIKKASMDNYLLVDSVKNNPYEPLELYDLRTGELINVFQKPKEKLSLTGSKFSVSINCKLLAYAPSSDAIFIYSVESGILISKKSFDENIEIQFLHFFDNDERLFILGVNILCIWNLLSTINEVINIEETEFKNELEPYKYFKTLSVIAKSNSTEGIIAVTDKVTKRPTIRRLMSYIIHSQKDDGFTNIIENFLEINNTYSVKTPRHPGRILLRPQVESYYLQKDPAVILSIGYGIVQVWRASDKVWVLEYIWASGETLFVKSLDVGLRKFSLVLTNQDPKSNGKQTGVDELHFKEIHIKIPDAKGMVTVVKHACQSLEYLYRRKDICSVDDVMLSYYNDIVNQTRNIIYKFIKDNPVKWMFMDIRYNVMANLIRARSLDLICLILFNDDEKINISNDDLSKLSKFNEQDLLLHRPQIYRWSKPENDEIYVEDNDLEVALKCYEENITNKIDHDLIIFACLWEYYLRHATSNVGWMISVTKILPRLIELKLDSYYIEGLLYKPCFELNRATIPVIHYRKLPFDSDMLEVALPLTELPSKSTSRYKQLSKNELYQINILPVVNFTVNTNPHELNLFKKIMYTFLPRNYLNHKKKNNSPFVNLITKKNFDTSFYANPIMEVVLEWMWHSARKHYLVNFMLYILHLMSFTIVSYAYTAHLETIGAGRFLFVLAVVISFYTSVYFLVTELKQMHHYGLKTYLSDLFNWFDILSAFLPLASLSIIIKESFEFKDGFGGITSDTGVVILFSFIILLLWLELVLLLRVFPRPSQYIYIFLNIISRTWPILFFNLAVIIGFAHAFFILLGFPLFIHLDPTAKHYYINDNITVSEEEPDNPFSKPINLAIQSVTWENLPFDLFDFWPVKVLSSAGSLCIVLIMQNMIIALMNGAYSEAEAKAKLGVLKFRSQLISDFESLEKSPWIPVPKQPKYFCFIDQYGILNKWRKVSDRRKTDKVFSLLSESIDIPDSIDDLKPLWTWDDR